MLDSKVLWMATHFDLIAYILHEDPAKTGIFDSLR